MIFKKFLAGILACCIVGGVFPTVVMPAKNAVITASAAESDDDAIAPLISEFRAHLLDRETTFSIAVPYEQLSKEALTAMIIGSLEDTGKGNEGDYLRWNIRSYSYSTGDSYGNGCYVDFTVVYDTTADQEKETDAAVAEILSSLDIGSGSDYDKILAAYDYVTNNIEYADDYTSSDTSIFTAYGAAVNKSAVCQGYAILLYRLLRELGINCRALSGTANGGAHMWNMAEIGGKYYLLDCTFDSNLGGTHHYFLRGSSDFDADLPEYTHVFKIQKKGSPLLAELESEDFFKLHPIAEFKYDPSLAALDPGDQPTTDNEPSVKPLSGDANEDGEVTVADAAAVLQYLGNNEDFPLTAQGIKNSDVDGNDGLTPADALTIQKHCAGLVDKLPL